MTAIPGSPRRSEAFPWGTNRARGLAVLAALALFASACGGDDDDDDAADEPGGAASTRTGPVQVLAASSGDVETQALQQAMDAFEQSAPGRTVDLEIATDLTTQLTTALAGGNPPDIFYMQIEHFQEFVQNGVLEPYAEQVEVDVYPALQEAFTADGTYYCVPKDFSTLALEVNTTMLQEAGLQPPTTWQELEAAAQALTTGDRVGLAIGPELARVLVFMLQAGGYVLSDDLSAPTANSPQNIEALTFLQRMIDNGSAKTHGQIGAGWPGEAFGTERAAMTIEGNWILGPLRNDWPDVQYEAVELPAGPSGPGTLAFTVCWGIPVASDNKELAIELVRFLMSDDIQLQLTSGFGPMPATPALRDRWLEAYPEAQAFIAGAEYARTPVWPADFQPVIDETNSIVDRLFNGQSEPQEVVETFDTNAADVLD